MHYRIIFSHRNFSPRGLGPVRLDQSISGGGASLVR
jgi:hypothetical protein